MNIAKRQGSDVLFVFFGQDDQYSSFITNFELGEKLVTQDEQECREWLESYSEGQKTYFFIDYDHDTKKNDKFLAVLRNEFPSLITIILFEEMKVKDLKKHQAGKNAADGYLKKPLTLDHIKTTVEDFELGDFIVSNELSEEGTSLPLIPGNQNESQTDITIVENLAEMKIQPEVRQVINQHGGDIADRVDQNLNQKIQSAFNSVFGGEIDDQQNVHSEGSTNQPKAISLSGIELGSLDQEPEAESSEPVDSGLSFDFNNTSSQLKQDELLLDGADDREKPAIEFEENDNEASESLDQLNLDGDLMSDDFDDEDIATELEFTGVNDNEQIQDKVDSPEEDLSNADAVESTPEDYATVLPADKDLEFPDITAVLEAPVVNEDIAEDSDDGMLNIGTHLDAENELEELEDIDEATAFAEFSIDNDNGDDSSRDTDLENTINGIVSVVENAEEGIVVADDDSLAAGEFDVLDDLDFENVELGNVDIFSEEAILDEFPVEDNEGELHFDSSTDKTVEYQSVGPEAELESENIIEQAEDDLISLTDGPSEGVAEDNESTLTMTEMPSRLSHNMKVEKEDESSVSTSDKQNSIEEEININSTHADLNHFHENELLRLQATIRQLREGRDELLASGNKDETEKKLLQQENLGLRAELDEVKIEISILRKRHQKEIDEMKYRSRLNEEKRLIAQEKTKRMEKELSRVQQKVHLDFTQVRQREQDLESKLELSRIDSDSQVKARDQKIVELKRKIDQLEFNMENVAIKEQQSRNEKTKLEDRLDHIMKTLRGSIELLEDDTLDLSADDS